MTASTKQPSLFSVATDALRNLITRTSSVSNELLEGTERIAKVYNNTAKLLQVTNGIYVHDALAETTAQQRTFLAKLDPTLQLNAPKNVTPKKK